MSRRPGFDGDLDAGLGPMLGPWLEQAAGGTTVTYLDEVLERTRRTRQRPAWSFPGRWMPTVTPGWAVAAPRAAWLLLAVALLLALLAVGLALVGARRTPPPFGLARPGLIVLDTGHHVAVMAGDGSAPRLLTSGAEADACATWSPDGQLIAFWRASGNGHWTIVVMDAAGRVRSSIGVQATTPLPYPSDDPRWSMLDFALGAPSVLAWSPDSSRLAFAQTVDDVTGIWVVGADGSGLRQLGDPALPARDPAWSWDGTQIVFHGGSEAPGGGNGIWVMGADGRDAHRVSTVEGGEDSFDYPVWQPGGELIAFVAQPSDKAHVYVVRSDGTGERDLSASSPDPAADDWLPTWSPDGSQVAWVRFATALSNGQIVVARPDGSEVIMPAMQPAGMIGLPMWSPDGRAVAVFVGDPVTGVPVAWMSVPLDGAAQPTEVAIADNAGGASWQRLPP